MNSWIILMFVDITLQSLAEGAYRMDGGCSWDWNICHGWRP